MMYAYGAELACTGAATLDDDEAAAATEEEEDDDDEADLGFSSSDSDLLFFPLLSFTKML